VGYRKPCKNLISLVNGRERAVYRINGTWIPKSRFSNGEKQTVSTFFAAKLSIKVSVNLTGSLFCLKRKMLGKFITLKKSCSYSDTKFTEK
jgi:hypothetical protein